MKWVLLAALMTGAALPAVAQTASPQDQLATSAVGMESQIKALAMTSNNMVVQLRAVLVEQTKTEKERDELKAGKTAVEKERDDLRTYAKACGDKPGCFTPAQ